MCSQGYTNNMEFQKKKEREQISEYRENFQKKVISKLSLER